MPEHVRLAAQPRTVMGKKVRSLRRKGIVPGNIYGAHRESIPIQLDGHELKRAIETHGATTLFNLEIPGAQSETVLIARVQHEPASGAMQHVDFVHVVMGQPLHARVPVHFIGDAPAVSQFDGILVHPNEVIEVEALPSQLPEALEVDMTRLTEIGQNISVGDLNVPSGITVLTDASEILVTVTAPKVSIPETPVVTEGEVPAAGAETPAAESAADETPAPATPASEG